MALTAAINRYFVLHKPDGMLSQFIGAATDDLLGNIAFDFPADTHAVGRLDKQSEGLLLLTTNKKVTRWLFQGPMQHRRTYLVKVKNTVSQETLLQLRSGIAIRVKGGGYYTAACDVCIIDEPAILFAQRYPLPQYPPYTWLSITIKEGKYHQIRKMVKAVHHPCRRLIRNSIEDLQLGLLPPGGVKEMQEADFFRLLKIGPPV